ncbi:BZ3500_MvSof-1268-A1-R1_Chr5-1g07580 [Microbotryum saponariae]|uniref:BZ3500_MvSof-1268-A1-R1_Chr5-1g07580 protein n=1 Tax=Microbotryum saponariae TaxID=289078 RepID=A0A2X0KGF8_9BASI|nr:BZ3500_MvSof-1268-A1-R1_Chr5-1g07580 [Microbotryum saponariae]SDA05451.1 BZ3501_MvSof-1269-A2-R1_Chr5-2g07404 [Microbotryum saponariae]
MEVRHSEFGLSTFVIRVTSRDFGLPAPRTSSPRFGTCTAFFSSNYTLTTLSPPTLTCSSTKLHYVFLGLNPIT